MKYSFEQTEQDYIDFYYYYYWVRPEQQRTRMFWRIVPVPVIILFIIDKPLLQYGLLEIIFVGFGIALSIFTTPYIRWMHKIKMKRFLNSGKNTDMTGQRTIELSENSLRATTDYSMSEIKWNAFEYLRETEDHLFLFQTVNQAIILPKRIFSNQEEMNSVKNFLKSKLA